MQRLSVNCGDQALCGRQLPVAQRPAKVAGDQLQRRVIRQASEDLGAAMPPKHRSRRAKHQYAAGQGVDELLDLPGVEEDVIEQDQCLDLAEQLGALLGGGLDRLISGVQLVDQALEQVLHVVVAGLKVDARAGDIIGGGVRGDLAQQR